VGGEEAGKAAAPQGERPAGDDDLRARMLAAAETALRIATQHWIDHPGSSLAQTLSYVLAAAGHQWQ
jgi:hypothetical protein